MRTHAGPLTLALLLALSGVAAAQDTPQDTQPAESTALFDASGEAQMLIRINAARLENHLPPVVRLEPLDVVARSHSIEMAENGRLAHVSETTGTPQDRVNGAGVQTVRVTENVANGRTSVSAQEALLASAAHRQNILDPAVTHVGIGSVRGTRGVYVTQVYAGLAAAQPEAAPEPALDPEPLAPSFGLIPPFVDAAVREAAAPVVRALSGPGPAAEAGSPAASPGVPDAAADPSVPDAAGPQAANPAPSAPAPLVQQTLRGLVDVAQSVLAN